MGSKVAPQIRCIAYWFLGYFCEGENHTYSYYMRNLKNNLAKTFFLFYTSLTIIVSILYKCIYARLFT